MHVNNLKSLLEKPVGWAEQREAQQYTVTGKMIGFRSLYFRAQPNLRLLHFCVYSLFIFIVPVSANALEQEVSGYVGLEYRYFPADPSDPRQHGNNASISIEPEYYAEWEDGQQSFTFKPFARLDQGDDERSHFDIREMMWLKVEDDWELHLGVGKIFWGVTEVVHLVDIVNQVDLVEDFFLDERLGQPMVNLALIKDWGTVDLFILPGFRERTYPGVNGRPRSIPWVDTAQTTYESSKGKQHVDYAARWSDSWGDWDIGFNYFNGTSREPRFKVGQSSEGETVFIPNYDLIAQVSTDIQATLDAWLLKFEGYHRNGQGQSYYAATGGFEYSFYGVFESNNDLGIVFEYMYDQREDDAPTPFQNDFFLGTRLTLNDEQSSDLLAGIIRDFRYNRYYFILEASRRVGDSWKISVDALYFSEPPVSDPGYSFRNDDYLQLEVQYYF